MNPSATKHIAEFAAYRATTRAPEVVRLTSQVFLSSLKAAVENVMKGGIRFDVPMRFDGWEFIFTRSKDGKGLPILFHADYMEFKIRH